MRLSTFLLISFSLPLSIHAQETRSSDNSYAGTREKPLDLLNPEFKFRSPRSKNRSKTNFLKSFRPFEVFKRRSVHEEFFEEKIRAFEKRMRRKAREYRRIGRLSKRPQYSDPLYFGHRLKPKKRALGNRKWCKTCGITH